MANVHTKNLKTLNREPRGQNCVCTLRKMPCLKRVLITIFTTGYHQKRISSFISYILSPELFAVVIIVINLVLLRYNGLKSVVLVMDIKLGLVGLGLGLGLELELHLHKTKTYTRPRPRPRHTTTKRRY
jgi:hypothetical protein